MQMKTVHMNVIQRINNLLMRHFCSGGYLDQLLFLKTKFVLKQKKWDNPISAERNIKTYFAICNINRFFKLNMPPKRFLEDRGKIFFLQIYKKFFETWKMVSLVTGPLQLRIPIWTFQDIFFYFSSLHHNKLN